MILIALMSFLACTNSLSGTEYKMQEILTAETESQSVLKHHFLSFYQMLAESRIDSRSFFKDNEGVQRCFSGISSCYFNMIMGHPAQENQWDSHIEEQLDIFKKVHMPFAWYVDEEANWKFKEKLIQYGFKDAGILQGVVGILNPSISLSEVTPDLTFELVEDIAVMDEWVDLVCTVFSIENIKDSYKKVMWDAAVQSKMFHWAARKEGKIVSTVSTLIEGDMVSFWNGASLSDIRRHGYSTALCHFALQHAIAHGCQIGTSYLMSEGLAYGICRKLGGETKWRFNAFIWEP